MKIAIITPTISSRSEVLEECKKSVKNQIVNVSFEHFIGIDKLKLGCGAVRNAIEDSLLEEYDWLSFIDDDDLMLPGHLQTLVNACERRDIIYSDVETVGWEKSWTSRYFDLKDLQERNYIPVTVLIRRSVFKRAGGFRHVFAEDWDLWKRCAEFGARFQYVPKVTWLYRRIANSKSMLEYNQIVF